jgi:PhnB protein
MELHAYLSFTGNCKEALDFYSHALNGKVEYSSLYSDNKEMCQNVPANWHDKIMHASFKAGNILLMASDIMQGDGPCGNTRLDYAGSPVTLSLSFEDETKQAEVFNKLAENGKISMPLQDTFWGAKFGMLTDKFGIKWMFNCEKQHS